MARRVFYSFHYRPDNWRASMVRNIGFVEGNQPVSDNDWETVTRGGDAAIKRWIDGQLSGRSCAVVLIGADTARRKWIDYEIESSWNDGKGVAGIYVHNLKDRAGYVSSKGANPFAHFTMKRDKAALSSIVQTYDPVGSDSKEIYAWISKYLSAIVEEAVKIRENY
jgi:hypothetical protein